MAENGTNVSVGHVTQADLNPDEAQREKAFQEFMTGNPFGAPPRQDQLGLTARNPDEAHLLPQEPSLQQQIADAEQRLGDLLNGTVGAPADLAAELADWKKKYGDRENEFGAMRREKAELEETLQLLLTQPAAPTGNNFSTGYQPNYSQPNQPVAMPSGDPFEGIDDNQMLEGHQVKRLVNQFIAPALQASFAQSEEARKELAAMKAQVMLETKKAAGIGPLDELRLRAKYPMLSQMPDSPEKLTLMKQLSSKPQEPAQPNSPQPNYSAPAPQAVAPRTPNVVQRLTHIEGSNGATGEPNTNPNLPFQVEMAAAEREPFHLRAAAMQKVMNKYKVPTVNTFGVSRYKV